MRQILQAFIEFPIVCLEDSLSRGVVQSIPVSSVDNKTTVPLAGVSSIAGIPLPDGGDYNCIPPHVVCTALGHIVHLLAHLGKTINITLPHPLHPFDSVHFASISPYGDLTYVPDTLR